LTEKLVVKLVSYIPGIVAPHLVGIHDVEEMLPAMEVALRDEIPATVAGILWASADGRPSAILIMERAREIAEHLIAWSENEPQEWFDACFVEHAGKYAMALFPRVRRSIERWRVATALQTGIMPPEDVSVEVMFRPLAFSSQSGAQTFTRVKGDIGDRIRVHVLDVSDMRENPNDIAPDSFIELGDFCVGSDESASNWLREYVEADDEPASPDSN